MDNRLKVDIPCSMHPDQTPSANINNPNIQSKSYRDSMSQLVWERESKRAGTGREVAYLAAFGLARDANFFASNFTRSDRQFPIRLLGSALFFLTSLCLLPYGRAVIQTLSGRGLLALTIFTLLVVGVAVVTFVGDIQDSPSEAP